MAFGGGLFGKGSAAAWAGLANTSMANAANQLTPFTGVQINVTPPTVPAPSGGSTTVPQSGVVIPASSSTTVATQGAQSQAQSNQGSYIGSGGGDGGIGATLSDIADRLSNPQTPQDQTMRTLAIIGVIVGILSLVLGKHK